MNQTMPAVDQTSELTEANFIDYYNNMQLTKEGSKSRLPDWAVKQMFEFLKERSATMPVSNHYHSNFFITHRAVALDCFFDNIVHQDSSSGQYLIYTP